jgi:hypothetical protein
MIYKSKALSHLNPTTKGKQITPALESFKVVEPEKALFEAVMALKGLYYHDALEMYRREDLPDLPAKFKSKSIRKAEALFKKYDVSY